MQHSESVGPPDAKVLLTESMGRKTMTVFQKRVVVAVVIAGFLAWFFVFPGLMRMSGIEPPSVVRSMMMSQEYKPDPEAVHKQRVVNMRQVCQQLVAQNKSTYKFPDPATVLYNIYVNDKYKFIYCSVPKIACTNWKRLLLSMNGFGRPENIETADIYNSKSKLYKELNRMQLNSYPPDEAMKIMKTYKKFVFVREPYERLLSAWRNKFTQWSNHEMHAKYGTKIIQQLRQNPSDASLKEGHDVTFEEFIKFILDPKTTAEGMQNEHWDSYDKLCHPCAMQYDYIGKYESMSDDIDFILNKLNVTDVRMPDRGVYYHTIKTSEFIDLAYREVDEQLAKKVYDSYFNDFSIFGYPYQNFHYKV